MSTIGVDTTLDERWDAGTPECGEDFCDWCGECLGCMGDIPCASFFEEGPYDRHVWVNSKDEVKLI